MPYLVAEETAEEVFVAWADKASASIILGTKIKKVQEAWELPFGYSDFSIGSN